MKKKIISMITIAMMLSGCGVIDPAAPAGNTDPTQAVTEAATETATEAVTEAAEPTATPTEAAATEEVTVEKEPETAAHVTEETVAETTAAEENPAPVTEDPFAGTYRESLSGRCGITLTNHGNGGYNVHIHWGASAFECAQWDFSGEFDGRQVLRYSDCVKKHLINTDGSDFTEETVYTDGTGYIRISEDGENVGLIWVDDNDNSGAEYFYVKEEIPAE